MPLNPSRRASSTSALVRSFFHAVPYSSGGMLACGVLGVAGILESCFWPGLGATSVYMTQTSALRHLRLPGAGVAVVNTDVHGNGGDFRRLEVIFRERVAEHGALAHWVILGDVVHGPS